MSILSGIRDRLRRIVGGGRASASVSSSYRTAFLAGDVVQWGERHAGMRVTPDAALTLPTYFAVLRVVSQTVAMLPMTVATETPRGGRQPLRDHPITYMLNSPHPWIAKTPLWQLKVQWAVGWGLGISKIIRDYRGSPRYLWPIHPAYVRPFVDRGELMWEWRHNREVDGDEKTEILFDSEVFRIHGMGGDGVTGYSLLQYAGPSIGTGLAHQEYVGAFFSNGIVGSGVVEHPGPKGMSDRAYDRLKQSLHEEHANPSQKWKAIVLEEDAKWHQLTIPNDDAQLVETGNYNAYQICRVAGVNPHKVGLLEGAKYKNIEEENIAWVQDGVMPWATRIEEEAMRKLFVRPRALYVHVNLNGLLRADYATRLEGYQKAVNSGWLSPNDIRSMEDLAPIPGPAGSAYYMQGANKTLDDIYDPPEPPAPPPMPFGNGNGDGGDDGEDDDEEDGGDNGGNGNGESAIEPGGQMWTTSASEPDTIEVDLWPTSWPTLAETVRPAFEQAAASIVARERIALDRVRKKYERNPTSLKAWVAKWQKGDRPKMERDMVPAVECLIRLADMMDHPLAPDLVPVLNEWQAGAEDRALSGAEIEHEQLAARAYAAAVNGGEDDA